MPGASGSPFTEPLSTLKNKGNCTTFNARAQIPPAHPANEIHLVERTWSLVHAVMLNSHVEVSPMFLPETLLFLVLFNPRNQYHIGGTALKPLNAVHFNGFLFNTPPILLIQTRIGHMLSRKWYSILCNAMLRNYVRPFNRR